MSTSLASKTPTIVQRISEANERAAELLHAQDAKRAVAAILEMAIEEYAHNPGFALRVRGRFDELAPAKPKRVASPKAPKKELVPIKVIEGREFDVSRALDPYFLHELYGAHQLGDALRRHPASSVKEAVGVVQERHPRTRPSGRSKEDLIEYVVRYVLADASQGS